MSRDDRDQRGGHKKAIRGWCECFFCGRSDRLEQKYGTKGARSDARRRAVKDQE